VKNGRDRKCTDVQELLSAYLDHELVGDDAGRIEAHLAQCPECRAVCDDLGAILENARSLPVIQPPAALRGAVRRRALNVGLIGPAPARLTRSEAVRAACAALVLLSLAGLVWLGRGPVTVMDLARQAHPTPAETSFQQARATCLSAIQLMEGRLEQRLTGLPVETRAVFHTEKHRIDEAIASNEESLLAEGRPAEAWEGLLDTYQHKVDFLAVFLSTDFGDPQILY